MPTQTIDMKTTQPSLHDLISLVLRGDEVLLVDGETPLARLVPPEPAHTGRIAGLHAGQIWTSDDFDQPLPDAFWAGDQ